MREPIHISNYEAWLLDYSEGRLSSEETAELKRFLITNAGLNIDLNALDLPYLTPGHQTEIFDARENLKKDENQLLEHTTIEYLEGFLPADAVKDFETQMRHNTALKAQVELYKKTTLQAESTTLFSDKTVLHKSEQDLILNNQSFCFAEGLLNAKEKAAFEGKMASDAGLRAETDLFLKTLLVPDANIQFHDKAVLKKKPKVVLLFGRHNTLRVAAALLVFAGLFLLFAYLLSLQPATNNTEVASVMDTESNKNEALTPKEQGSINEDTQKRNIIAPQVAAQAGLSGGPEKKPLNIAPAKKTPESRPDKQQLLATNSVTETSQPLVNLKNEQNKLQLAQTESNTATHTPGMPGLITETLAATTNKVDTTGSTQVETPNPSSLKYLTIQQLALTADEETEYETDAPPVKKGIWQRALNVVKQANLIGMKGVESEESINRTFISFRGFSVEKK